MIAVSPPPMIGGPTRLMNLVLNWSHPYDPGSDTRVSDVRSVIDRMIGILEQKQEDALEREHSLAGRIARLLRFPIEVREAVGAPAKSVGGVATVGVGYVFYGVVVVAGGTVLGALILRFV